MLAALNTYRVLTYDMMLRLGVASNQKDLGLTADYLDRTGLIGINPAAIVKRRGLPNLHWLTPKGAAVLFDIDPASAATGADRTSDDYHETMHRLGLVELHIALRAWAAAAGVEVVEVVCDFDRGAQGERKATTLRDKASGFMLAPDLLAWVRLPDEDAPWPLVIELERGGERGDLTVFFSRDKRRGKLRRLREASAGRLIEHLYARRGEPIQRPRFLVVFGSHARDAKGNKVELHRKALDRWPDGSHPDWNWFFIKDQDEAAADFGGGWHQPGDRPPRPLFGKLAVQVPPVPA